jgi:hypothetical protein
MRSDSRGPPGMNWGEKGARNEWHCRASGHGVGADFERHARWAVKKMLDMIN